MGLLQKSHVLVSQFDSKKVFLKKSLNKNKNPWTCWYKPGSRQEKEYTNKEYNRGCYCIWERCRSF